MQQPRSFLPTTRTGGHAATLCPLQRYATDSSHLCD
jgi:hypothetical protein